MNRWLKMWTWRIQENAAARRPEWLHALACPFCRGMAKHCQQQQRERAAS